mmetsp:Transcript_9150/g.19188  ORF Transcript_9150/g.19188 Transcript_9150/m.19188 type:complete len:373 (-) Transcript_9150:116-1234(-)
MPLLVWFGLVCFRASSFLDFVENLALRSSGLEVLVSLGGFVERKDGVDGNVELSILQPSEDLFGSPQKLFPGSGVVQKLGSCDIGGLADQAQHGEGGDGPGSVAKGDKDSSLGQGIDRDIDRALSDSVDDALDSGAAGDLHHPLDDVHALVVLEARAGDLVQDDQLVAPQVLGDVGFSLGHGTDDLETTEFRHLGRPLAGSAAHAVNQAPLTGLDQIRVRRRSEVVGRQSLDDARGGNVETDTLRYGQELGGGDGGVLAVGLQNRVGNAVADLDPLRGGLFRDVRYGAASFLSADEGEFTGVQSAAVVGVDKVDARVLVLDNDLAGSHLGSGVIGFDLHGIRVTDLANHGGLHGIGNGREASSSCDSGRGAG